MAFLDDHPLLTQNLQIQHQSISAELWAFGPLDSLQVLTYFHQIFSGTKRKFTIDSN